LPRLAQEEDDGEDDDLHNDMIMNKNAMSNNIMASTNYVWCTHTQAADAIPCIKHEA
jgi:hypothetical protein